MNAGILLVVDGEPRTPAASWNPWATASWARPATAARSAACARSWPRTWC